MMFRQIVTADIPPVGTLEQTTDLSDEREVDGVKVAHKIVSSSSVQNFTVTISKVEHNGALDQTLFSKPRIGPVLGPWFLVRAWSVVLSPRGPRTLD